MQEGGRGRRGGAGRGCGLSMGLDSSMHIPCSMILYLQSKSNYPVLPGRSIAVGGKKAGSEAMEVLTSEKADWMRRVCENCEENVW